MSNFQPNRLTFDDCLQRINEANKKAGFTPGEKIVTSRDKVAKELLDILNVDNIPGGFNKWQLPFHLSKAQLFISVGQPGTKVPSHSHDEGAGIRFIISGSISYEGKELNAGDWMYIPKGSKYSFEVGQFGVSMAYCYECCCA